MEFVLSSVKTNKFEMEYIKFGSGKKTLVIVPGVSLISVMKQAQSIANAYEIFTKDYTVYLFDRIKKMTLPYTVFDMANDLISAIDILKIKKLDLFGVSQGGMISEVVAIKRPDLVNKMVLGSTTSKISKMTLKNFEVFKNKSEGSNTIQILNDTFYELLFTKEYIEKYKDVFIHASDSATEEDINRFMIMMKANENFDVYNDLTKIKAIVLVIGAKLDKMISVEESIDISKKLNCELYIYENYAHAVYDEAPDYKNRLLEFFIK